MDSERKKEVRQYLMIVVRLMHTHILNDADRHLVHLLRGERRRFIGQELSTQSIDITSFGFIGRLLTSCPFPFHGRWLFIVLTIR